MNDNSHLDKLINIIHSLNGNIFGEIIRDYNIKHILLNDNIDNNIDNNNIINNINIIFNNNTIVKYFIRILSFNYEIYKETIDTNDNKIDTYNLIYNYLYNNQYKIKILKINIFPFSLCKFLINKNIEKLTYDLDCNQFFTNKNSLYLCNNSMYFTSFQQLTFNNFNLYFSRIKNNNFSFIKKNLIFNDYIYNIDQAYSLVNNGWMMDDLNNISRDNSCILLKWKNKDKHNYRTNYNLSKYNQLKSNDSCSICGTNFTNECIIINTSCNHNFHWYCNNKHGLKYWIQHHNNSCPICRLTDFI